MKNSIEGLKELGRLVMLAVISYLLTAGVITAVIAAFGVHMSPETQLIVIGFVTTVLKAIDKWLHETGKELGDDNLKAGLTRF